MTELEPSGLWVDREAESRALGEAVRQRRGVLIWGPEDTGKTALVQRALAQLSRAARGRFLYLTGPAGVQELLRQLVRQLYDAEDAFVRGKAGADSGDTQKIARWLRSESSARLRGMAFRAMEKREYCVFLDHFPPLSHAMARLIKEIMWRCGTPVYLTARGCSQAEIGYAWSLYWTDRYRLRLGPLPEDAARRLLERCIRRFALARMDLDGFREEVLSLSGRLPGAIRKMCALAAQPKYQYERRIKTTLVHVDYLMGRQSPQATGGAAGIR